MKTARFYSFVVQILMGSVCSLVAQVNQGMQPATGRWMQIADNPTIALPVFTAECWVKFQSGGLIVTRDHRNGDPSDWQVWCEWSRKRLAFITALGGPPDSYYYTPDNTIAPNVWYHIAITANGPAGRAKLYVNGNLIISPTFASRQFDASTGLAWGGYFNNSTGSYLNGFIDEARYWNYERTQAQISAQMNTTLPLDDRTGLMGYWMFCGGFADSSGNRNHGTAPGNPAIVDLPELPFLGCCTPMTVMPSIVTEGPSVLCKGDSVRLKTATGYRSYLWSTGDTTTSIIVRQPGIYTVSVWDGVHCTASAQRAVQYVEVHPVVFGPTTLCNGDTIDLEVAPVFLSYDWSTGERTQRIRITGGGTYSVTVRDSNGCTGSVSHVVRVDSAVVRISGPRTICPGDTIVLDAGAGYALYLWSTTEATRTIRITAAGRYAVAVMTPGGCRGTDVVDVVEGGLTPSIAADRGPMLCEGDSATLDAGGGYASYTWSTGATTRKILVRSAGWYSVAVSNGTGCTGRDSILIMMRKIAPVISGPSVVCDSIGADLDAGAGYVSYRWSTNAATRSIRVNQSGTYRVTVVDSNGCVGTAEHTVTVRPPAPSPVVTQIGDTLISAPALSYQWYRDGVLLPGENGRMLVARQSGMYMVRIVDSSGCPASSVALRVTMPVPQVTAGLSCVDSVEYEPGDIIHLPIVVHGISPAQPVSVRRATVFLHFEKHVLQPMVDTSIMMIDERRIRSVAITAATPGMLTSGTLFDLPLTVMLGDTLCTNVILDSLVLLADTDVLVELQDTLCRICVRTCRQGGARLYRSDERVSLFQNHPNPFNAETIIEYHVSAENEARLDVYDTKGNIVATLFDGHLAIGMHRAVFHAESLPSGVYAAVLRSASLVRTMYMMVLK